MAIFNCYVSSPEGKYRFGRCWCFCHSKVVPLVSAGPMDESRVQFQAAYCVGATRGLFGGKRIGDKASAAERCLLQ